MCVERENADLSYDNMIDIQFYGRLFAYKYTHKIVYLFWFISKFIEIFAPAKEESPEILPIFRIAGGWRTLLNHNK